MAPVKKGPVLFSFISRSRHPQTSLEQTNKDNVSIGCESSLIGFVDYAYFSNYSLLANNGSTFLLTMCHINWACSLNIRYIVHDKSQECGNFKWKL